MTVADLVRICPGPGDGPAPINRGAGVTIPVGATTEKTAVQVLKWNAELQDDKLEGAKPALVTVYLHRPPGGEIAAGADENIGQPRALITWGVGSATRQLVCDWRAHVTVPAETLRVQAFMDDVDANTQEVPVYAAVARGAAIGTSPLSPTFTRRLSVLGNATTFDPIPRWARTVAILRIAPTTFTSLTGEIRAGGTSANPGTILNFLTNADLLDLALRGTPITIPGGAQLIGFVNAAAPVRTPTLVYGLSL